MKRKVLATAAAVAMSLAGLAVASSTQQAAAKIPVTGAAFTSVDTAVDGTGHCQNGNPDVNCNIYDGKQYVWLNGGPLAADVGDGTYFFAVLDPGGQADPNDGAAKNLSDDVDAYTNRTFSLSGGVISYGGTHDQDTVNDKIRLADYADTSNPGGVYIMAICSLGNGYPVNPSDCKYDAFKVKPGGSTTVPAADPTITKDAAGSYDTTYAWGITKSADKTLVKQVGGSVTFTYTVTVSHDAGTNGNYQVKGTIDVENPNFDDTFATVPITVDTITDQLSDGTVCIVDPGLGMTLNAFDNLFGYTCSMTSPPAYGSVLSNTAEVTWSDQDLTNQTHLAAGSANFTFTPVVFSQNPIDDCVNVTDTYAGTLGAACVGDANPKSFTYQRIIAVPTYGCLSYDNTATFTTNDSGGTGSASQTVKVCGPVKTGALTIGFWQNKNGQGIITGGAAVSGTCKSGTWLRQYAPFQDLSSTASCAQVGTYVTNVIKAASAAGTAMNPMLKAQMLATALDTYFSDPALGGNKISAPVPIGGVAIDLTKICKMIDGSGGLASCNNVYVNVSAAFGGASSLTVSQMLAYAASQSNAGGSSWYGQVKATQGLAKDAFDAINNQVAFAA